jgi:hypothetical protein
MTDTELEAALKHIRENCTPTDVFTREELIDWIAEHEEVTDVFPIRKILLAVKFSNAEP